jgi:hypothetical protein
MCGTQMKGRSHSLHYVLKTHTVGFKFVCSVHEFFILSTAPLPLAIIDTVE